MTGTKFEDISDRMLNAICLIETAKDACSANDLYSIEYVLNASLEIISDLHDEIELMY